MFNDYKETYTSLQGNPWIKCANQTVGKINLID